MKPRSCKKTFIIMFIKYEILVRNVSKFRILASEFKYYFVYNVITLWRLKKGERYEKYAN